MALSQHIRSHEMDFVYLAGITLLLLVLLGMAKGCARLGEKK